VPAAGTETSAEALERQSRLLRQAGWTVVRAQSGDSFPDLWRLADRGSAAASGSFTGPGSDWTGRDQA
jgi:hypothetical protein